MPGRRDETRPCWQASRKRRRQCGGRRRRRKRVARGVAAGPQQVESRERDLDSGLGVLGLMGASSKEQDGGELVGWKEKTGRDWTVGERDSVRTATATTMTGAEAERSAGYTGGSVGNGEEVGHSGHLGMAGC